MNSTVPVPKKRRGRAASGAAAVSAPSAPSSGPSGTSRTRAAVAARAPVPKTAKQALAALLERMDSQAQGSTLKLAIDDVLRFLSAEQQDIVEQAAKNSKAVLTKDHQAWFDAGGFWRAPPDLSSPVFLAWIAGVERRRRIGGRVRSDRREPPKPRSIRLSEEGWARLRQLGGSAWLERALQEACPDVDAK
jgi:hypothetical protein